MGLGGLVVVAAVGDLGLLGEEEVATQRVERIGSRSPSDEDRVPPPHAVASWC